MSNAPAKKAPVIRKLGRAPAAPVLGATQLAEERTALSCAVAVAVAVVTPLLEKNAIKTLAVDVPLVFSMSRIVVLAFAVAMVRQLWRVGLASWPEAAVAMTIVLALPMVGAIERARPEQSLEVLKSLFARFGVGEQRSALSLFTREPSRYDNHWSD